jgi:hypothetical protein
MPGVAQENWRAWLVWLLTLNRPSAISWVMASPLGSSAEEFDVLL